eukprot:XP_001705573.1 Hypothetical protein GL50803_19633 [Giardia lamblia ATCC 50803]
MRTLWECLSCGCDTDLPVSLAHLLKFIGCELRIRLAAIPGLDCVKSVLKLVVVNPQADIAEHLHEAAVGVVRKAGVTCHCSKTLHRLIVETKVEDRVHHARHGDRGSRANRDEKRVCVVPESLPHLFLKELEVTGHLLLQTLGPGGCLLVLYAGLARDGEPKRNRHAELNHGCKRNPLASKDLPAELRIRRLVLWRLAEEVHPPSGHPIIY